MDTNEIYEHGRARFEHAAARRLLQEKYQAKMLFAYSGGLWRAGPELMAILSICREDQAVILDSYHNPVRIPVKIMQELCYQHWQEQMNAWLIEHEDINRQR